jgi:hypothetical protein
VRLFAPFNLLEKTVIDAEYEDTKARYKGRNGQYDYDVC